MKNYVSSGDTVTVPAPSGGVTAGELVVIGDLFGVAATTADEGAPVVLYAAGVYEFPKVSAQAWTAGAGIYWDSGNKRATTASSGNTRIGAATAAAANPSPTGRVRLNPAVI